MCPVTRPERKTGMLTLIKYVYLTAFIYFPAAMFWLDFIAWKVAHK